MRFLAVLTLLSVASAAAIAEADAVAVRAPSLEEKRADVAMAVKRGVNGLLEKRLTECPKSNGCKCASGTRQGQYCGFCAAVTAAGTGGSWEHIFECNSSGGCCDYGPSTKCAGNNWDDWCPK